MQATFPRAAPGEAVALAPDVYNLLVTCVEYCMKLRGDGNVVVDDDPFGGRVIWCNPAAAAGLFPVNVTQNGGSQGVANVSPCSYSYDIYRRLPDGSSGEQIGTAVSVVKPRLLYAPVNVATVGVAFYDADGTLALWDVGETYGHGCD